MSTPVLGNRTAGTLAMHGEPFPPGFVTCGNVGYRGAGDNIEIAHRLTEHTVSDDAVLSALLGLIDAGVLAGQEAFERLATEIICSVAPDQDSSWAAFYDNSVRELRDGTASFAPVHRRARDLVKGLSVLEVGSCFGFLALQCALDGHRVIACDISSGAVELLSSAARRRQLNVTAVRGDATDLPLPADAVDTVTLIHLLEHLDESSVHRAIDEAVRVARTRVVIAVPFEEHPSEHFGHLLRLTDADLARWAARRADTKSHIFTDHGGWLVLDL